MIAWLTQNKEWFLSGLGVTIISIVAGIIFREKSSLSQKSGKNSTNYQAGESINIGNKNDK
ncbi:hypothetical protein [Laribacter hongkongensis]|uniref:hypothetical protein n=1 Tax=Laribacter hongkongensis TaxID=168471 RepID=UPI001EFE08C0|nr:hypothetical protein [Laribacter hongkongensis]MCG9097416.1 hypothetical protein [Laribacter hongkongensis]